MERFFTAGRLYVTVAVVYPIAWVTVARGLCRGRSTAGCAQAMDAARAKAADAFTKDFRLRVDCASMLASCGVVVVDWKNSKPGPMRSRLRIHPDGQSRACEKGEDDHARRAHGVEPEKGNIGDIVQIHDQDFGYHRSQEHGRASDA